MRIHWGKLTAALIAAACLAMAWVTATTPLSPSTYQAPPGVIERLSQQSSTRPTVAIFVGDSYTAGAAGVDSTDAFACQTASKLGWFCNLDAQGGTGYIADGHRNNPHFRPYIDRLPAIPVSTVDWVVVSGGRNDGAPAMEGDASLGYLSTLQYTYPRARIVVLAPFWVNTDPPAWMQHARWAIRDSARAVGATWVDTNDWLTFSKISSDGVHPTPAGHRLLARHLTTVLRRLGATATIQSGQRPAV